MAYYQGTTPQQITRDPMANGIPAIGGPGISGVGASMNSYSPATNNQTPTGAIQPNNAVLQNIGQYTGSLGTLQGNAQRETGLQNYNQMSRQYGGQFGGNWTPYGLQNGQNNLDYFVNPTQGAQVAGGSTFDLVGNGQVQQRENLRNPYSGAINGYGSTQNTNYQNPLAGDFWNTSSKVHNGYFGEEMQKYYDSYLKSLGSYGSGAQDVNNIDPSSVNQQAVLRNWYLNSAPKMGAIGVDGGKMSSNSPGFHNWLNYGQQSGMFGKSSLQDLYSQYAHGRNPAQMATTSRTGAGLGGY